MHTTGGASDRWWLQVRHINGLTYLLTNNGRQSSKAQVTSSSNSVSYISWGRHTQWQHVAVYYYWHMLLEMFVGTVSWAQPQAMQTHTANYYYWDTLNWYTATTSLENLETSWNMTPVRKMSGNWPKGQGNVTQKSSQGKNRLLLTSRLRLCQCSVAHHAWMFSIPLNITCVTATILYHHDHSTGRPKFRYRRGTLISAISISE